MVIILKRTWRILKRYINVIDLSSHRNEIKHGKLGRLVQKSPIPVF